MVLGVAKNDQLGNKIIDFAIFISIETIGCFLGQRNSKHQH
jgi:hypothetical protein